MNDITKHKWSDEDIHAVNIYDEDRIIIMSVGLNGNGESLIIAKDDSIAIAKHFHLFDADFLATCIDDISYIPQSHNTYPSLNLDKTNKKTMYMTKVDGKVIEVSKSQYMESLGEMKQSEIIGGQHD